MKKKSITMFVAKALSLSVLISSPVSATSSTHSGNHPDSTYGYKGMEVSRTSTFEVDLPGKDAFYLFTPIGEITWEPEFNPSFYGGKTEPKRGRTFSTEYGGQFIIWQITDYDPEKQEITYSRIIPDRDITLITVDVDQIKKNKSIVSVTYDYTSTSQAGDKYVKQMDKNYVEYIASWKVAIDNYLATSGH